MSHPNYRWPDLIDGYLKGRLTDLEKREMKRQMAEDPWKQEQFERYATMKGIMGQVKDLDRTNAKKDWKKFEKQYIRHTPYLNYTIAAVLVTGVLVTAMYLLIPTTSGSVPRRLPALALQNMHYGNDALFILPDGTTINIDSIPDGEQIASNIPYIKKNTQILPLLIQNAAQNTSDGVNIVYIPAGKQYQLTLPDGTVAKLNAASRVYFPMTFRDNYRLVGVDGEVYFKVAKNDKKPFLVNIKNRICARVSGTAFNITAYDDNEIRTTLEEGVINICRLDSNNKILDEEERKLIAGQQAHWKNDIIYIINAVNLKQVTAWTNGEFNFEKKSVSEIMQEISRWYKVKVKYNGQIPTVTSTGYLPRSMPLPKMIKLLESTNQVHITETPGSILIVSPQAATNVTE